MWFCSELYRRSLYSAERVVRVELWRDGAQWEPATNAAVTPPQRTGYFPWITGSVKATLANRVTRTLTLSLPEHFYPWETDDSFNPYGDEVRVSAGIRWGTTREETFPVFVGRISKVELPRNGTFKLTAVDLAAEVAGAGFARPVTTGFVPPVATDQTLFTLDEFRRLVADALPDATFGISEVDEIGIASLTYADDRGKALDDLAASVGALWHTLADGSFVMRRIPWLVPGDPVATLSDGPKGILIRAAPARSREGVHNSFRVVSERTDGAPPLTALVEDRDPASPINVLGRFGRKTKLIKVENATAIATLDTIGRDAVNRARSLASSWSGEIVPDAALELGDACALITVVGGVTRTTTQVVAGFTFPLGDGSQQIDFRAQQDDEVTVI